METAVRKATRLEYRPPKVKHLQSKYEATCAVHVLKQLTFLHKKKALKNLTFENPASIDGILVNLEKRLRERSWIVSMSSAGMGSHYLH